MNENIKITRRGITWVLNGKMIVCPECGAYEAHIKSEPAARYTTHSGKVWTLSSTCNKCLCEWDISREERDE